LFSFLIDWIRDGAGGSSDDFFSVELFRFDDLLFDSDFFSDGLGSDSWDFGRLVVGLVGLIGLIICDRSGVSWNLRSVSGNG
jgi:hypothetical protein